MKIDEEYITKIIVWNLTLQVRLCPKTELGDWLHSGNTYQLIETFCINVSDFLQHDYAFGKMLILKNGTLSPFLVIKISSPDCVACIFAHVR